MLDLMTTAPLFARAVEAVVDGDEGGLRGLLALHPDLVRERSPDPHRATLLHYVGANGIEPQRSPKNAPAIARILLEEGAEVDALAPICGDPYNTPLCLTVTSVYTFMAGVQAKLVDVFLDHGARIDGVTDEGGPLGSALLFGYTRAAERLAIRGARVDNIVFAAGLGRTDVVRLMLATGTGVETITRRTDGRAGRFSFPIPRDADAGEVAMIVGAIHDRVSVVRTFLDAGLDVNATPFCNQTALHFAAQLGCADVLDELLARGADIRIVETQFNKTPIDWALEGGHPKIAERLRAHERCLERWREA
jgi:ankyrin repeat protein